MLTSSVRRRLADGVKRSGEAAALLVTTLESVTELDDVEIRQYARSALDAMDRLQERLQLLAEAHRIADRHRAADLDLNPIPQAPAVGLAEQWGIGTGASLARVTSEVT
ncbi:MAG TPA: hypothetical protein VMV12_07235 [Candidatus Micrarchaeaceae archaeon]|nr:hypothetical protein [Candidatus Micrarchaeaceae archaeon]